MERVTVIIPTSPIPSHPSTRIIDETIASVRKHLPDAPIIITCDGVSDDQQFQRPAYEEYLARLRNEKEISVVPFLKRIHQSGMMEFALAEVKTPLLLYLEHDWTLGHPIEWDALSDIITIREANYIKFHAGDRIHPLHEHMMGKRIIIRGVPIIGTVQYSANPHLATTEWYRKLIPLFSGKVDFIENLLHGPIANAQWSSYRCAIYNPIEGGMKRAFHLDGKGSPA